MERRLASVASASRTRRTSAWRTTDQGVLTNFVSSRLADVCFGMNFGPRIDIALSPISAAKKRPDKSSDHYATQHAWRWFSPVPGRRQRTAITPRERCSLPDTLAYPKLPFRAQFLTKLVEKGQVKPDRILGTPSDEAWLSKT